MCSRRGARCRIPLRQPPLVWALLVAAALCTLGRPARATTVTFDAGAGAPLCYTEAGMTVCSQVSGGHLHLGDNDGNGSPDLANHGGGCCSSPYAFDLGSAPFTLVGFEFVYADGTHTFTSSSGATLVVTSSGPVTFPAAGWSGITSFTWDVTGGGAGVRDGIVDNLVFTSNCGNGTVDAGEECDDGNGVACDGCSPACRNETGLTCGDGTPNAACGELCDDGNLVDGDGCDSNCTPTGCGNGIVTAGEQCDDGNTVSCDGCSATCQVEAGLVCGDGVQNAACGEGCDDGNLTNGEQCDDGNTTACDGCSPTCQIELGSPCPVAVGPQFRVDVPSSSYYNYKRSNYPKVAAAAAGDFVVVWQSYENKSTGYNYRSAYNVRGRRFDRLANPGAAPFKVNTHSKGNPSYYYNDGMASVAAGADGRFVVVWYGYDSTEYGVGCTASCVFVRRYGPNGGVLGGEFALHTSTLEGYEQHANPEVAMDGAGNFVVVWEGADNAYSPGGLPTDEGVFGRRLDGAGNLLGSEFHANTNESGYQGDHGWLSVDSDPAGNFVVVWAHEDQGYAGIFGQRYDSAGNRQGGEFQVDDPSTDYVSNPEVALDGAGNFVVVWKRESANENVFARRFDSAGNPLGAQFQVNTYTGYRQYLPAVAADSAGDFVVAWSSRGQDGSGLGVFARRFDSAGNPQGGDLQVNTFTSGDQGYPGGPDVTLDGTGNFVVVWDGYGAGNSSGVFGQRFLASGALTLAGKKLLITNKVPDDKERNLGVWLVKDSTIEPGTRLTTGDPRCNDSPPGSVKAALRFFSNSSGHDSGPIALPCQNWTTLGPETGVVQEGYKYRDTELDDGPCKLLFLRGGNLLKALCVGKGATTDFLYDLTPGVDEGVVNVVLTIGPLRYCTAFTGFDGRNGSDGKRFQGKNPPPPAACPLPPP